MTRTVLVTGANSGIGLQTALECARLGFDVVGTVRSTEKGEVLTSAAAGAGLHVRAELLDVTDADACERLVSRIDLYGLVNNAGYLSVGAVEDVGDDEVRRQLETMVVAPLRLARLALPAMRRRGAGRVVNVSSVAATTTTAMVGWYQAAKHALEAVTDALRIEVAPAGVRVVSVRPGGFETGIWDRAADEDASRSRHTPVPQAYRRALGITRGFRGHLGDPAAVARVIGRALTAPRPRARYRVGGDVRVLELLDLLAPIPVKDRVVRSALGL